jgi:hypothetical protein
VNQYQVLEGRRWMMKMMKVEYIGITSLSYLLEVKQGSGLVRVFKGGGEQHTGFEILIL